MINLNEYDGVVIKVNSWIDPQYKRLYSDSIKRKPYFTILKKYNPNTNTTDYYLVMLDKINNKFVCDETNVSNSGTVKVPLDKFWDSLPINKYIQRTDIYIEFIEEDEHTIVYYLDI